MNLYNFIPIKLVQVQRKFFSAKFIPISEQVR